MVLMSGNWQERVLSAEMESRQARLRVVYTFCGFIQFSLESDMISVQRQVMNSNELK